MASEIPTTNSCMKTEFSINITARSLFFILSLGIGVWIIPYLIKHIGIAVYGLIPLATSITHYINLATSSIQAGISRYLTVDIQQNNPHSANKTFNTALFLLLAILLIVLPLALAFCYFIPEIFDVPTGFEDSTRLLFAAIILMFMVETLKGVFATSPFALNRTHLIDGIRAVNLILRVIFVVVLFNFISPRLEFVGLAYLGGASATLLLTILLWKKVTPQLQIKLRSFDRSRMHDFASTGGWIFVDQIGILLLLYIDLILINKLFGPTAGGEYALILQLALLLRTLVVIFSSVLKPIIYKLYAQDEHDKVIRISKTAVKLIGLAAALPIGLLCGFVQPFLSVWVGPEYAKLAPLAWILIGHWSINLSYLSLFSIQVAYNKVKLPGIITLFSGFLYIGLALVLSIGLGWKMYGVAAASALVLTLRHLGFTTWYSSRILGKKKNIFLKFIFTGGLASAILGLVSYWLGSTLSPSSWIELALCASCVSVVYIPFLFFVMLKSEERRFIMSFMPRNPVKSSQ